VAVIISGNTLDTVQQLKLKLKGGRVKEKVAVTKAIGKDNTYFIKQMVNVQLKSLIRSKDMIRFKGEELNLRVFSGTYPETQS
jgi:hypothetical protein